MEEDIFTRSLIESYHQSPVLLCSHRRTRTLDRKRARAICVCISLGYFMFFGAPVHYSLNTGHARLRTASVGRSFFVWWNDPLSLSPFRCGSSVCQAGSRRRRPSLRPRSSSSSFFFLADKPPTTRNIQQQQQSELHNSLANHLN